MPKTNKSRVQPGGIDLSALLMDACTVEPFFSGDAPQFVCTLQPAPSETKLVAVTGDNASGKSFWCAVFSEFAKMDMDAESLRLGMGTRTDPHLSSYIYGPIQGSQSCGAISVNVVYTAFSNCVKRTNPHVLILDEPDLGLSDRYAATLGAEIARLAGETGTDTLAVVVVTHSKALLRGMRAVTEPTHVRMGDEMTLDQVIDFVPAAVSVDALKALPSDAHAKFRAIRALS